MARADVDLDGKLHRIDGPPQSTLGLTLACQSRPVSDTVHIEF